MCKLNGLTYFDCDSFKRFMYLRVKELIAGFFWLIRHASRQIVHIVTLLDNSWSVEVIAQPQGTVWKSVLVHQAEIRQTSKTKFSS